MRALITHECSGHVREELRALGHDAWSCDLVPAEDGSPFHIQGDAVKRRMRLYIESWVIPELEKAYDQLTPKKEREISEGER